MTLKLAKNWRFGGYWYKCIHGTPITCQIATILLKLSAKSILENFCIGHSVFATTLKARDITNLKSGCWIIM